MVPHGTVLLARLCKNARFCFLHHKDKNIEFSNHAYSMGKGKGVLAWQGGREP